MFPASHNRHPGTHARGQNPGSNETARRGHSTTTSKTTNGRDHSDHPPKTCTLGQSREDITTEQHTEIKASKKDNNNTSRNVKQQTSIRARRQEGSTNAAYAEAWIGHDAPFPSDALTVNAFLGLDTLEPLLARADAVGAGLFVLTRTSNPGAGDLQDLDVGGKPLFHRLAEQLAPLAAARCDDAGHSSLGIVAGATWPDEARALRAILPSAPFLVPGFGAQGGAAADALAGLTRDSARDGDGWQNGLINSTRGLIFPKAAHDAGDMAAWRAAIDEAITASRDALAAV